MVDTAPQYIVKINGDDRGKIYEYRRDHYHRPSALWQRRGDSGATKVIELEHGDHGDHSDYKVYEPKVGDNISSEGDLPRKLRKRGSIGFIIDSIQSDMDTVILRDKTSGFLIENRSRRSAGREARKRLVFARCINSKLFNNVPIDLIENIGENIKILDEFSPAELTLDEKSFPR
jgi:hypothetical protein